MTFLPDATPTRSNTSRVNKKAAAPPMTMALPTLGGSKASVPSSPMAITPPHDSFCTSMTMTPSSSAATFEDHHGVGLPLDSSSDDNSVTLTPCSSRRANCIQSHDMPPRFLALQPPDLSAPARPTPADKKQSCVDCGGCLCCCDCHNDKVAASASTKPVRVHSIKLGQVEAETIEGMFDASSKRLSSKALTLPMSEASYELKSTKSLLVRKMGDIEEDDDSELSEERLFADGDDPNDNNKSPSILPRTTQFGSGCAGAWASAIHKLHVYTTRALRWLVRLAATNPKKTVAACIVFSLAMLTVGFFTNFEVQVENWYLWPPQSSLAHQHTYWFYYDSEFPYETSYFDMIVHARGDNVLSQEGVQRTFDAIDAIQELEGYKEGCYWAQMFGKEYYLGQCKVHSVADFWNESRAIFEDQIHSDAEAARAMSAPLYPNGMHVDEARVLGKGVRVSEYGADDDSYTALESAQSLLIEFDLPWTNVTEEFEWRCLQRIQELQEEWDADPNNKFTIEYNSQRSFGDEFYRSIIKDLPLLPCVFCIMSAFCCFVFWKRDRVQSRMVLGVGAVVCILLSIFTGYGLLFCFGVPFTTVTTMMPFLMFGIGLDDAFIIYGSYNRLDRRLDPVERILETIDDVGVSITLTTVTSSLAFFMGVFSSIPAVSWVCWYAFPTILIDFFYQITFFIALIVLDEQRIADNRYDLCFCAKRNDDAGIAEGETFEEDFDGTESPTQRTTQVQFASGSDTSGDDTTHTIQKVKPRRPSRKIPKLEEKAHFADRFMYWFAKKLLLPKVQAVTVVLFLFVLMSSVISTTKLHQKFNYVDMVPDDSYMKDYHEATNDYTVRSGVYTYAFFRDVDQSDPVIQDQMMAYIEDMTNSGAIDHYPVYFWLRDFKQFVVDNDATLGNRTFEEQVGEFFKDPGWEDIYGEHVAILDDGTVKESRCVAFIDVDLQYTKAATAMLNEMREVDARQPINNDGRERWAFFTYADDYHMPEFYNVVVEELVFTTIMGVLAVSFIAVVFIPHWTAVFFVFPFISFLYIDMLGFLYIADVQVNAISYITLVMSIGLMVDFIMHILLRYYESKGTREQRVVETLSTMGASILLGAISTFLGVLLLVFSTSEIITNIFVSFIGLISFGVMHGLIFLPTLLAMVGPE